MLILAMALSMLGGAQAVARPIPSMPPRVRPMPLPRVTVPAEEAGQVGTSVQRKPDLLVKEIRMKDENSVRILIANEGTAASDYFHVQAFAYSDSRRIGETAMLSPSMDGLAIGEARWYALDHLIPYLAPGAAPYPPPVLRISEMTEILVSVDPEGPRPEFGSKGRNCSTRAGCIAELNEDNNDFRAKRSEFKSWNGGN